MKILALLASSLFCLNGSAQTWTDLELVNLWTNAVYFQVQDLSHTVLHQGQLLPGASANFYGAASVVQFDADPPSGMAGATIAPSVDAVQGVITFGSPLVVDVPTMRYSESVGVERPTLSTCIDWWFWGVCSAIILGLSGASRRLLGRVHEVNTDL